MKKSKILISSLATLFFFGGLFSIGFLAGKLNLRQKIDEYLKKIDKNIVADISENLRTYFKEDISSRDFKISYEKSKNIDISIKASLSVLEPENEAIIGYFSFFSKKENFDINYINLLLFLEGKIKFSDLVDNSILISDKKLEPILKEVLEKKIFDQIHFFDNFSKEYQKTIVVDSSNSANNPNMIFFLPAKEKYSDLYFVSIDRKIIFDKKSSILEINQDDLINYPLKIIITTSVSENIYAKKIEEQVVKKFNDIFGFEFFESSNLISTQENIL